MPKLGINIDHVATLRQARREVEPDPIQAAKICEKAGADSIVAHLREDRRHINEQDIKQLRKIVTTRFNLEISAAQDIVGIAIKVKPDQVTLVPEKRNEITTEGGLDVVKHFKKIVKTVESLQKAKIAVSLFIDPIQKQIQQAKATGATIIELHTGSYANAKTSSTRSLKLQKLKQMSRYAQNLGLLVHAGHGLNYHNTKMVAKISEIDELNIGHAIIARSVFTGLPQAVKDMKGLC